LTDPRGAKSTPFVARELSKGWLATSSRNAIPDAPRQDGRKIAGDRRQLGGDIKRPAASRAARWEGTSQRRPRFDVDLDLAVQRKIEIARTVFPQPHLIRIEEPTQHLRDVGSDPEAAVASGFASRGRISRSACSRTLCYGLSRALADYNPTAQAKVRYRSFCIRT
jgi:hypothetical protein